MKTKRFSKLLFATLIFVAAAFAFQTVYDTVSAMKSNKSKVGMGDLHRLEAAQALPNSSIQPYIGMGDLHRIEAAQALPTIGIDTRNQPYVGMGDLHRYEFEQGKQNNK
jgi:hypothetical protein